MRTLRTLVLVAGLLVVAATPAAAAPPSTTTKNDAVAAAQWLTTQVTSDGFIASAPNTPDYSATLQSVLALEAAGVGQSQVTAMLDYIGAHLDAAVQVSGVDAPGALAYLILGLEGAGVDPTAFGTPATDLVARLAATRHTSGTDTGLYGTADPSFDGAFRQGLALLALEAAGTTPDATAVTWLANQQCANGLWTAYRSDTSVACPAVDASTFSGPDTNSTALALLGLHAAGDASPVTAGTAALLGVRNSDGGWGFLAATDANPTDANSTGVVLTALRTIDGSVDANGAAALVTLQLGCDADPADVGAFRLPDAFDPTHSPNVLATVQAIPGIADVAWPLHAVTFDAAPVTCAAAPTSSTTTTTISTTIAVSDTATTTSGQVRGSELPRTGSDSGPLVVLAIVLVVAGSGLVVAARRRLRER
jgi:LPXTG-motif cell wall-anchored protein